VFLQTKLVCNKAKNWLEYQGKQRHAGKHQSGLSLIELVDIMQPYRKKRQYRAHDKEIEKAKGTENPKIPVF
jgi:hypothetical protein